MVAAVPAEERFGYFGYLKKMILTLHNIVMMKRGLMPYHGAMFRIALRSGAAANVLIIGDTATGKSESLEAFRRLGGEELREIRIVADDMGSLEILEGGGLTAYGTEIGAFVRLDDLQPGYAFDQIDRSVIMSPHRTNARVVLPVTTQEDVLRGYRVDILMYANNYEEVDISHPVIERFEDVEDALAVFREGRAMTKGTTTSTGMFKSYFANIFGPPQSGAARGAGGQTFARRSRPAYSSASCARSSGCPGRSPPALAPRPKLSSTSSPRNERAQLTAFREASSVAGKASERSDPIMTTLYESNESAWELISRGKVRDVYEYAPNLMLIVTSDRLSAFDVVLPDADPRERARAHADLQLLVREDRRHHRRTTWSTPTRSHRPVTGRAPGADAPWWSARRSALPVEAIVRGYLTGSGWKDYKPTGTVCGIDAPAGLEEASRLPEPIFTPSTKAESGGTTRTSASTRPCDWSARRRPRRSATRAWRCTRSRRAYAHERGIIIADTKFEFGCVDGDLDPDRRGAHPGLVAVLADGRLRARPRASPASTSSTCATTSRRSTGTRRRPARSSRRKSWRRHPEKYLSQGIGTHAVNAAHIRNVARAAHLFEEPASAELTVCLLVIRHEVRRVAGDFIVNNNHDDSLGLRLFDH